VCNFSVADGGDVAAGDEELHDLGAFAGEGGPARGGCRVLLEAADALTGKVEIDLGELALGGGLDGIGIIADEYAIFAFDEYLTPDGEESFVEVGVFVFIGHLTGRASG
jgi:hypothetical protein